MVLTSFDRRENAAFLATLRRLGATTSCQGLTLQSFLTLPMQRITRLPLLVDAACHRMDSASAEYQQATLCLHTIQKVRTSLEVHHRAAWYCFHLLCIFIAALLLLYRHRLYNNVASMSAPSV